MAVEPAIVSSQVYNERLIAWSQQVSFKLKGSIQINEHAGKGKLLSTLRGRTAKNAGEIDRISYVFARHGVFWHKGVGRGYIMISGKVYRGYRPSKEVKAYAKQKNRIVGPVKLPGDITRRAVEWFNPVIRANMHALANMVAEMRADQVINESKILIK